MKIIPLNALNEEQQRDLHLSLHGSGGRFGNGKQHRCGEDDKTFCFRMS